ncbi:MAG: hypothetical protein ACK4XK_14170, partial [Casimicrobiaceae bacterium]
MESDSIGSYEFPPSTVRFMLFCILIQTLKATTWLYAWFWVPIGMLVGGISKLGNYRTQWAGHMYKGQIATVEKAPRILATG